MEEVKPKKKMGIGIGISIAVLIVLIVVLGIFLLKGNNDDIKESNLNETEQKQLEKFNSAMKEDYMKASTMELSDAQDYLIDSVYENLELYGGNDSVEYMANSLLDEILNSVETTANDLVSEVENLGTSLTDQLMDGLLGQIPENVTVKNITIKSSSIVKNS